MGQKILEQALLWISRGENRAEMAKVNEAALGTESRSSIH